MWGEREREREGRGGDGKVYPGMVGEFLHEGCFVIEFFQTFGIAFVEIEKLFHCHQCAPPSPLESMS